MFILIDHLESSLAKSSSESDTPSNAPADFAMCPVMTLAYDAPSNDPADYVACSVMALAYDVLFNVPATTTARTVMQQFLACFPMPAEFTFCSVMTVAYDAPSNSVRGCSNTYHRRLFLRLNFIEECQGIGGGQAGSSLEWATHTTPLFLLGLPSLPSGPPSGHGHRW